MDTFIQSAAAEALRQWCEVHGTDIVVGIISVQLSVAATFAVMFGLVKGLGWLVRRLGWGS